MKNNQNNEPSTPSEIPPQSGQAVSDINQSKKYEIIFDLAEHSIGSVILEAKSPDEARQKADKLCINDVKEWDPVMDEMSIESVVIIEVGGSHD